MTHYLREQVLGLTEAKAKSSVGAASSDQVSFVERSIKDYRKLAKRTGRKYTAFDSIEDLFMEWGATLDELLDLARTFKVPESKIKQLWKQNPEQQEK